MRRAGWSSAGTLYDTMRAVLAPAAGVTARPPQSCRQNLQILAARESHAFCELRDGLYAAAGSYNAVVAGPGHLALAPEIDEFRQQFERLAAEADALVAPLTEEQFTWRPAPGSWSIAECIDHLNSTARLYLPRLDEGIAEAIRRGLYGEVRSPTI